MKKIFYSSVYDKGRIIYEKNDEDSKLRLDLYIHQIHIIQVRVSKVYTKNFSHSFLALYVYFIFVVVVVLLHSIINGYVYSTKTHSNNKLNEKYVCAHEKNHILC